MTVAPALRPDVTDESDDAPRLMSMFDSVALLDAPPLLDPEPEWDTPRPHLRRSRPVPTEERPWAPWRVRVTFVVSFVVVGIPISALMLWFWSHSRPAHGLAAEIVDGVSYIWVVLAIPVLLNVIGALTFRNANTKQSHDMPLGSEVCFRIVTRGTNVDAVLKTARAVQAAMTHTPLFPYSIEIVTDNPLPVVDGVRIILVPKHYRTGTRARFKARALEYTLEASPIPHTAWLFHLDEETHITPSVIRGIHERGGRRGALGRAAHRPGRGAVPPRPVRAPLPHPGRLRAHRRRPGPVSPPAQLRPERVRHARVVHPGPQRRRDGRGVRHRPGGLGHRGPRGGRWWRWPRDTGRAGWTGTAWSSPPSRSWTSSSSGGAGSSGCAWSVSTAPARFWHRVTLVSSIILWGIGWLGWWSVSIAALIVNARIPWTVLLIGTASLAAYSALYLLGLELNLNQRGLPWYRRLPWHIAQVLLLPIYSLLESSAVLYGAIRPNFDFHIVKK